MPAADRNTPTKQIGQPDQTMADDFVPRQQAAIASGASPAEVLGARPVPQPGQMVTMSRHGEPGKPLAKFDGETMTIITNVTIHHPTEDHVAAKLSPGNGAIEAGHYSVWEIPPGNPVTLEKAEAQRILARFGGREVAPGENPPKVTPDKLNDRGPEGDTAANPPGKPTIAPPVTQQPAG